jgi:regulator of sigma D
MGLFDFLLGKKNVGKEVATQAPEKGSAPQKAAPVQFDPAFIPALVEEHRSLVALFVAVKRASEAGDAAAVRKSLQEFQMALNMHLAVENARFYAYLRRKLNNNSPEMQTMNAFFDEMQEIGKVVTQFLRTYTLADFTAEIHAAFSRDLEAIGTALVSRIEREEQTLYKLYAA